MRLALLHTSPAHIPVFEALRDAHHPGLVLRHHVDESLLARAREEGAEAVVVEVREALERAVAEGVDAVLCTCSSIGGVAEAQGTGFAVPVVRVDRPMAAEAVAAGERIVVLATVASTLDPTADLVREEAGGRPVTVRTVLVDGAWELFAAGDGEGYARAVADAVDAVTDADAIVLAQASMTPAERLVRTAVPVFSSPRPGLAAAAAQCV
ncbi:aspartate/glutamate racemase family protein [Streptomyces sp. NPDC004539]|uniref:aspartate/glutamate racemase family protein n=1 Tax=Streptomyces sp. NPDC004539 TaxID=3154280 RepID=UPI0033B84A1F